MKSYGTSMRQGLEPRLTGLPGCSWCVLYCPHPQPLVPRPDLAKTKKQNQKTRCSVILELQINSKSFKSISMSQILPEIYCQMSWNSSFPGILPGIPSLPGLATGDALGHGRIAWGTGWKPGGHTWPWGGAGEGHAPGLANPPPTSPSETQRVLARKMQCLPGNTPVHSGMGDARSGSRPPGEPRMIREPGWSGLAAGIPAPPGALQERANKNTETDLEGDCWRQENAFYFSAVNDASWAHLTRRG